MKKPLKKIYCWLWGLIIGLKLDSFMFKGAAAEKPVIFILPYMGLGGIENTILSIAAELKKLGKPIIFISTIDTKSPWEKRFKKITPSIYAIGKSKLDETSKAKIIAGIVKRNKPSAIVLAHPWESGYLALQRLKAGGTTAPVIEIILGAGDELEAGMRSSFEPSVRGLIDSVVAVSESTADFAAKNYGLKRRSIKVIRNGVNVGPDFIKTSHENISILWAGRAAKEKRLGVAVHAIDLLRQTYPNVHLTVAGSGPEIDGLVGLVKKQKLEANVTFSGMVENMTEVYEGHDILWVTSLSEGIPLVMLEAMERKLAVISTDCGGVSEALEDGKNGILVTLSNDEFKQAELMAAATKKYLEVPPERRLELSDAGRQTVKDSFNARGQLDAYAKLILGSK